MKTDTENPDLKNCGVLYVATGRRFVGEALASLKSLRTHHPELPAVLFTDLEIGGTGDKFLEVRRIAQPENSFADKIAPLALSPFEKTLFLDTDTRVCRSIGDIFAYLDHVELAAAHAPMRVTWPQPDIPDAFPEINSGVMAWRKCERTTRLFSEWERLYRGHVVSTGQKDDQPALRRALMEAEVRIGILPPEYNFRTVMPAFAGRGAVRIIHGRHADMAGVERQLNNHQGCRVVLPGGREFAPDRLVILSGGLRFLMVPLQGTASLWFRTQAILTKCKRKILG